MSFIETERLYLRTWMPGDVDEALETYGDPEVMKYTGGAPRTRETMAALIERMMAVCESGALGFWPVIEKSSGAIVGVCGINRIDGEANVEIGWMLRRSVWGKGYATEAALAVLAYARDKRIDPVYAFVELRNARSIAMFPRLGMVFDRVIRHDGADMMRYTTK
jgi:RimJ/RimL family protein N-acetyltransferase